MNEYNRKLSKELIKRYNPIEEQDLKDLEFNSVSLEKNKYDHIDGEISFSTQIIQTNISVDIKDRKSIKRGQAKNDDLIWIEIRNPYGFNGWAFGKANYIAFKQEKEWLFVWREDLVKLIKEKVEKVFVKENPIYKLYNRKGSKDILTLIKKEDLNPIIIPRKL